MRKLFVPILILALGGAAGAAGNETHVVNEAGAKATIECTAEKPEVALNGSDLTITITGACTKVAVNGSTSKITIASVEKLAVNGSKNQIDVDAAGKIAVTGSENKVTWKKGTGGKKKPKIAVLGTGNDVKQAQ